MSSWSSDKSIPQDSQAGWLWPIFKIILLSNVFHILSWDGSSSNFGANAPVDGAVDQNIDIKLLKTEDLCTDPLFA